MDPLIDTLKPYIQGKGLDISRKPLLKSNNYNIQKFFKEPDNFFSLKSKGIETFDFILIDDIIQETKYHRIIIKESFYALKKGGYLIISYTPKKNKLLFEELEKEIIFLMKDSAEIVYTYIDGNKCTIVSKKTKDNPSKPEGINNWSFGIITRGITDNIVDEIIENIREQKIPHYEIIVCGKYAGKYLNSKDVKYIYFMEKDDKGWITKKKNIICENAKYENLFVMHDRIKLHNNWFSGMKKYGNNWEILSCIILHNGKRTYDWLSLKYPLEDIRSKCYLGSHLDYSDWDKWIYIDGGMIIMKKYVWEKVPWENARYYAEAEDSKLSQDQVRYGFLIRFNPYSTCESFRFNHPYSKIMVKKNPKRYGRLIGPPHLVLAKYVRGYGLYFYYKIKEILNIK
ncbi:MAG: hypothetical protein KatS3mg002_0206 [Candidatus Woesearchaeota archaeon]|nr:MAG: hypothetical protein KatS3mg002_0206 [Candidatus Woesearchaeota archaeon]